MSTVLYGTPFDSSKTEMDENMSRVVKMTMTVNLDDLRIMAGFSCQHGTGKKHCDSADIHRGACCNSCWARRWAQEMLKKSGENID